MTGPEGQDPTAIRIERTYAAPVEEVFAAWTSPELLRRWYPPGADWDTPVAEVDLRVGGRLRLVMRGPDGEQAGGGGEYREVTPPTRLVFTWSWDRSEIATGVQLVEVDFTGHPDGTTTVVMTNRGLADERTRESHRDGWQGSFDNLARLVSR
ncbi:MAG: SRPBCC domain-containing protein [Streptosporangiales bacterium]|nr:SRPBCC domain-containing protein [Streptosporangiales bacterium]MBO0890861.1 SRPBCC domain-containing protein [Acidothermales bacterium]